VIRSSLERGIPETFPVGGGGERGEMDLSRQAYIQSLNSSTRTSIGGAAIGGEET
jgi:hypothetical protein